MGPETEPFQLFEDMLVCFQLVRRTLSDRALYTHMLSAQGCALSAQAIFSSSSLGFFSQHAISARALSARALLARALSADALSARALSARVLSQRAYALSSCALSVRCQLLLFFSSSSCSLSSSSLGSCVFPGPLRVCCFLSSYSRNSYSLRSYPLS